MEYWFSPSGILIIIHPGCRCNEISLRRVFLIVNSPYYNARDEGDEGGKLVMRKREEQFD